MKQNASLILWAYHTSNEAFERRLAYSFTVIVNLNFIAKAQRFED